MRACDGGAIVGNSSKVVGEHRKRRFDSAHRHRRSRRDIGDDLLLQSWWLSLPGGSFLSILDEHGNVLRDSNLGRSSAMDFKRQPNGMLTYFDNSMMKYYGLDSSSWQVVDSFEVARLYHADGHELRVFRDTS